MAKLSFKGLYGQDDDLNDLISRLVSRNTNQGSSIDLNNAGLIPSQLQDKNALKYSPVQDSGQQAPYQSPVYTQKKNEPIIDANPGSVTEQILKNFTNIKPPKEVKVDSIWNAWTDPENNKDFLGKIGDSVHGILENLGSPAGLALTGALLASNNPYMGKAFGDQALKQYDLQNEEKKQYAAAKQQANSDLLNYQANKESKEEDYKRNLGLEQLKLDSAERIAGAKTKQEESKILNAEKKADEDRKSREAIEKQKIEIERIRAENDRISKSEMARHNAVSEGIQKDALSSKDSDKKEAALNKVLDQVRGDVSKNKIVKDNGKMIGEIERSIEYINKPGQEKLAAALIPAIMTKIQTGSTRLPVMEMQRVQQFGDLSDLTSRYVRKISSGDLTREDKSQINNFLKVALNGARRSTNEEINSSVSSYIKQHPGLEESIRSTISPYYEKMEEPKVLSGGKFKSSTGKVFKGVY